MEHDKTMMNHILETSLSKHDDLISYSHRGHLCPRPNLEIPSLSRSLAVSMIASPKSSDRTRSERANGSQVRVNRSIKEFYALRDLVFDPCDPVEILLGRLHITAPSYCNEHDEEEPIQGSIGDTERASDQGEYTSNENTEQASNQDAGRAHDQSVGCEEGKDAGHHKVKKIKNTKEVKDLDEEQLAAATWHFLSQSDSLLRFLNRGLLPPPSSPASRLATKLEHKRKPEQNVQVAVKQVDVLILVHLRDISRPDQELLPPYHIDFKDFDCHSFGYLFSQILDKRTRFLESFGVSRLGGVKKVEATVPCALTKHLKAEVNGQCGRTKYSLEGIADWARTEKLWRDFLEDTKETAGFESREEGQGHWSKMENLDEDLGNGLKDVKRYEGITPHGYAEVILYFRPEYEALE